MSILSPEFSYFNRGLGLKDRVAGDLAADYNNRLIDRFGAADHALSDGRLTVTLAKEFGFCYGVELAVQYAYETMVKFPGKRLYLTSEIIHNPRVNSQLEAKGIRFLAKEGQTPTLDEIRPQDVVVIPAFGVPVPLLDRLRERGCILVDTTCSSVVKVWKRVEQYAKQGITAVVHGKYEHEETQATCSRVTAIPGGRYLVVRNLEEAQLVCDYIEEIHPTPARRKTFLEALAGAASPGFDPDRDLTRVGVANQTTMLSSESMEIARRLAESIRRRHGDGGSQDHFRSFDTICTATQDRQDAVRELVGKNLSLILVIGGFASSNTTHLAEIMQEHIPAYHIEGPDDIVDASTIRHKPVGKPPCHAAGWLPAGTVSVGVTAGASTPDSTVGETIARLFELANGRAPSL